MSSELMTTILIRLAALVVGWRLEESRNQAAVLEGDNYGITDKTGCYLGNGWTDTNDAGVRDRWI